MEYRAFGRTGLRVSRIGFGGAPMGIPGYLSHDDRDAPAVRAAGLGALREAVARGINYFDVAPGYGDGRAEDIYGEALEPHRDRVVLATKYWIHDEDWTPETGTRRLRESLDRLRARRVDVLQLHGLAIGDAVAARVLRLGVLDWADEMRARGLCRFTGISAEAPSGALESLLRTGRFDAILMAYNLIYQAACDYQREPFGVIPLARSLGLGIATMRPTTSGFLQRLFADRFPGIAEREVTRLAIGFVLSTPEVDCAVIGMRNAREVTENVALAEDEASRLDLKRLHDRFDRP